jgi:diguanylate cyclase (GGDEF)-like protein
VLEHNRNQNNGEPFAQPTGVELPSAIRADLLDPALWQDGLAKYARGTHLAVALADAAGRLIGETINPRPTWSLLHARPRPGIRRQGSGVRDQESAERSDVPHLTPDPCLLTPGGCPFSVVPLSACNCVADALARGGVVVARDRTGLAHFAVPLVLGGHPLGSLVAGQVFTQYPEQLPLEQIARQLLLSPGKVWELARLEHPVKQATLEVYADLLATLGQTFLQTHYNSLREAERLAEMTRLRDHAMAEATQRKRVEESQHFLAEASTDFTSLDYETTLKNLARRAVPFLADFCFFDVVTPDERIQRVGWAHADPAKQELFDKVCRLAPALNFKDRSVAVVAESPAPATAGVARSGDRATTWGHPDFEPEITDAWMQAAATSPQHLQFMRDLGLSSMMAVPLIVHERKLGALTFCYTAASGRRYSQRELRLAEELARRTAIVVENANLYQLLRDRATRDSLTGLWNRAMILEILQRELARSGRERKSVTIIMADIDHFKSINDTHGHLVGDQVLSQTAQRLVGALRPYDTIGRYGGEEFLVVLPNCSLEIAVSLAERLCHCVDSEPIRAEGVTISLTVSLGTATWDGNASATELLRLADEAMYRAKKAGRNRAFAAHIPAFPPTISQKTEAE